MNTKEMALDISKKIPYEPADDRILVKPLKPVMITKEFPVQPNEEVKDLENLPEVKKFEKRKVLANVQKGVIIKLGTDYTKEYREIDNSIYEIGDIVMFPSYAGIKFELFKDAIMFRRYELLGKVTE